LSGYLRRTEWTPRAAARDFPLSPKASQPDLEAVVASEAIIACECHPGNGRGPYRVVSGAMTGAISIVVVEPDRDRALQIVEVLKVAGGCEVQVIASPSGLARPIRERDPDVVLVDVADPSRDVLEDLAVASGPMQRAVALFVDRSDFGLTKAAIDAGVSAYVVGSLDPARIRPILDAAIARFRLFQRLRNELLETRRALEDRKVIDLARGVLMKARDISKDEAHALLRRTAMDQNRRMADMAQALVTAAGLLS
jgi:response regulator NasT